MNRSVVTSIHPSVVATVALMMMASVGVSNESGQRPTEWQSPPEEVLKVLYAPQLPRVWTAPTGEYLLLADPVLFLPLAELAAPMHKLAGIRVNPATNSRHGRHGGTSPRLVRVNDGDTTLLDLPTDAEVHNVEWTVDGRRFALTVGHADHIGLWVGSVDGEATKIEDIALNPLMGVAASWLPDQEHLLVRRIPQRGPVPEPPAIPAGPQIVEAAGASARSTFEATNLLKTAYDDALFEYYTTSELVVINPTTGKAKVIGAPAPYTTAEFSPDGAYLLVERLVRPWSHEVTCWRFASKIEIWDDKGGLVANIASLPVADEVPVHGVRRGPRWVSWRATAGHTLFWIEALDGGDPVAKVRHRDRLMRLRAPFTEDPEEVYRAEHRIWKMTWGGKDGMLMVGQWERMRRWQYFWLLDVDEGAARLWYDLDQDDRYGDPGTPVLRQLPNGRWVMHQNGNAVYFSGGGATEQGERPFLDLRNLENGQTRRLWRCDPNHYEYFVAFAGDEDRFVLSSESAVDVPNYYLATFGKEIEASEGEATRSLTRAPITHFKDPAPQVREIEKRIVQYKRKDGVPLSFQLYLPAGYKEGTRLPTVLAAYPREYSGAATAGQVRGSAQRFLRLNYFQLFFLLRGYAVLNQTTMPVLGDPETAYDTFVPQLVADAEAAVSKAVEIGVADPERIGVIGQSFGALMVANLLAHTDLFRAGIAINGSYNQTTKPFGFQNERRSLFEARDVYIQVSPTFFANQINEPILIMHGAYDSNPGTRPFQSECLFEAVRGSGGTARLVLLPFEDHGYRARESVEHALWEQLRWFDRYVKDNRR